MPKGRVTLPPLHRGQHEVREKMERFNALACGRRWGKTRLGSALCVEAGLGGGRAWWVAPSYKTGAVGWRLLKSLCAQIPGHRKSEMERLIELPTGGSVQVRSADDPDSLRGEGLDFLVMDECAFVKENAWAEVLRPALSDRQGRALFISTPKGHNWFWRLHQVGLSGEPGYVSFRFPTNSNPYIKQEEIDQAKRTLPERVFRQEYEAEFIEDAGGVFRKVVEAATGEQVKEAEPGRSYVAGVDWGKQDDFTVISVYDDRGKQVWLDRFNQIDYALQLNALETVLNRFRPSSVVAEKNAMGEPLVEQLQRKGWPVEGFTTTNASKAQIIDGLTLAFEQEEIEIIPDEVQIGELQAYERTKLPSGSFRYSAPEGMHDDTVMANALAWYALKGSEHQWLWI